VVGAECLFAHSKGAPVKRLGVRKTALSAEHLGQMVECRRDLRAIAPGFSLYVDEPLLGSLCGFDVPAGLD
jgi:hypothetical protein